jgi:sulfur-carrier protein
MAKVKIEFYGKLAESTGLSEDFIDMAEILADCDLDMLFKDKYNALSNEKFIVAVNQEIVSSISTNLEIKEIALLPPFAGG